MIAGRAPSKHVAAPLGSFQQRRAGAGGAGTRRLWPGAARPGTAARVRCRGREGRASDGRRGGARGLEPLGSAGGGPARPLSGRCSVAATDSRAPAARLERPWCWLPAVVCCCCSATPLLPAAVLSPSRRRQREPRPPPAVGPKLRFAAAVQNRTALCRSSLGQNSSAGTWQRCAAPHRQAETPPPLTAATDGAPLCLAASPRPHPRRASALEAVAREPRRPLPVDRRRASEHRAPSAGRRRVRAPFHTKSPAKHLLLPLRSRCDTSPPPPVLRPPSQFAPSHQPNTPRQPPPRPPAAVRSINLHRASHHTAASKRDCIIPPEPSLCTLQPRHAKSPPPQRLRAPGPAARASIASDTASPLVSDA